MLAKLCHPPRQKSLENQLITGNSLYILKRLASASAGLVCLDPSFNSTRDESERVIFFICGAKLMATETRRKGKGQGDPGAAMAYLRRLHGSDPDPAPVTGYGLLTAYPLVSWLWRDGAGVLLSDPLAALAESRPLTP